MIAEGKYRARAIGAQVGQLKNEKGTKFIRVMFEITAGPELGTRMDWDGWINTPENVENTVKALIAAGWRGNDFSDWTGLGETRVQLTVTHEPEQNPEPGKPARIFAKVKWVNKIKELYVSNPLNKLEIEKISQEFAHVIAAARGKGATEDTGADFP